MSIDEIVSKIASAKWFSQVGLFPAREGMQPIRNLAAWDRDTFAADTDAYHAGIAAQMDWLPTTRDQVDPFYGETLRSALVQAGPEAREKVMEVSKQVMKSLRAMENSKLTSGPNDFSEAAIGGAIYCSRMAAMEAVIGNPAVWNDLLELYSSGFWPCGRLPSGDIVVY